MSKDEIQSSPQPDDVEDGWGKQTYKDADKALEFLRHNEAGEEYATVDEKGLVRRIDWMIVPIMFACYFLQYLDKSLRR